MSQTIQSIEAAAGCARSFEFRIKTSAGFADMSSFASVSVVVDNADGTDLFTAPCAQKTGDPTTRIVTVEGAATEATTSTRRNACVHWTDAAGKSDAERFWLVIYAHA